MKKFNKVLGFTLVEIMVGIIIFSLVIIGGFQALTSVNIGKVRLMQKIDTEKQNIYFIERFFEEIKKGGTIDYEEYFNRTVLSTDFSSGHYLKPTGFGNFGPGGNISAPSYGAGFYYCASYNSNKMDQLLGCFNDANFSVPSANYSLDFQRYGQYSFQFIDYNSNFDNDNGDEDGDGEIIGDDDDEYLGEGPIAFGTGVDLKELYLIGGNKKTRTQFRWNVKRDPDAPTGVSCSIDGNNVITGSGCLGTIEFLKLEGKDWGMDHDIISGIPDGDFTESDGVIDTWIIADDFSGGVTKFFAEDSDWLPLFPNSINISDFKIFLYPSKDPELAWKNNTPEVNISPYTRIHVSMLPSRKIRRKLKGNPKEVNFSTTISLTDIFSK